MSQKKGAVTRRTKIAQSQSLVISALIEPNRQKSCRKKGFCLRNRNSKSQIASDFPWQPYIVMHHCFVLSRKSLAIYGVRDGRRYCKSQKLLRFRCAKCCNAIVNICLGQMVRGFWPCSDTPFLGHTPSTAGTFRKKFRKNSGKTP